MPWGTTFRGSTVMPVADDEPTFKLRLGAVITEIRLARGFKRQGALAEKLKVSEATVQRWESGTTMPNAWDLRELARVLKVDPGVLIDPPDQLSPDVLDVTRRVGATVRREIAKRNARRQGNRGG